MTKSHAFLALTLLGVGAYAWYTNTQVSRMQREMTTLRAHALAGSRERPDQATTILTERYRERFRDGQTVRSIGEPAEPNATPPQLPPDLDPLEMRHRADENAVHLEQAVFGEPKDPAWDAQAESEIQKLDELFPGSKVRATECRKTMCYIDVVHDNVAALGNWSMRAALEPTEAFASRLSIRFAEPDGKVSTKVFLVRKGEELPAID
jgi:hypothetical protein